MLQRLNLRRRWSQSEISWAVCVFSAALFVVPIVIKGMPALRHDWMLFRDRSDFFTSSWDTFGGWTSGGIGAPRPYPTDYLLIAANTVLVAVFGTSLDLAIVLFLIGLSCARAGWLIAGRWGAGRGAAAGTAIFFTFNPWVYSKIVAGHIFMILACAAMALLILELTRPNTDERLAGVYALLTLSQLQFFTIALLIIIAWAIWRRRMLLVLTALIAAAPMIVGIIESQPVLLAIPYNLTWQIDQSVDPVQALILRGYFAKYAQSFPIFSIAALWGAVAMAVLGALVTMRWRSGRAIALAAVVVWLTVTGTRGFAAGLYAYVVVHVPQSGLFRELYDLVGYSAMCYASLASAACAKWKLAQWPWLFFSCLIAVAWLFDPPSGFWASLQKIPRAAVNANPNSRFALMPPFQPLQFRGTGSGLDPDAFARASNVTPLNTAQFTYPSDAALSRYAQNGDTAMLSALSVSDVSARPWFSTDRASVKSQTTFTVQRSTSNAESRTIAAFRPELTIEPLPSASYIVRNLNDDSVWFSDVAGLAGPGVPARWKTFGRATALKPSNATLNPRDAWVDVRLAFPFQPELAQGIGGALTMSRTAPLPVKAGESGLVFVRGALVSEQGNVVSRTTGRYKWIAIPREVRAVLCKGECVVAAQGSLPRLPRLTHVKGRPRALAFAQVAPWFALGTLPPSGNALLRYNVRFDPSWVAVSSGERLLHFKVAMIFNGWIVPAHARTMRVILVETLALVQFTLEAAGILWTLGLLSGLFRKGSRSGD